MATHLLPVFYAVLQLIVLMAVGYAARRLGPWSDQFFQGLNRLVVRVALPLYFAVRVGRMPVAREPVVDPAVSPAVPPGWSG